MALPTAVKRNADKARQAVAGSNGAQAPAQTPQSSDGEFLNVGSDDLTPSQGATDVVSPVSARSLADQQARLESERHVERREDVQGESGTYVPHALSPDYAPDVQPNLSGEQQVANSALSHEDTAAKAGKLPDFIDPEDWKARYAALRASRDERSASLEQENRSLKASMDQLQSKAKTPDAEVAAAKRFELDENTRAALGEDQSQAFDQLNESVEDRFKQQEAQQQAKQAQDAERFEANLGSMVPRWRDINVDPNFLTWLSQEDEVMGLRRQTMLDAFVREFDAASVAALFRSYAKGSDHGQQRNGQQPSPELSSNRSGAGLGAEEQMVEVWDQSEIADFYQAKNRLYQSGKLKGEKLEKVLAEEARIRKAMEEGRVNQNA